MSDTECGIKVNTHCNTNSRIMSDTECGIKVSTPCVILTVE